MIDAETCINCGVCDSECPVKAISEKNGARWINPKLCVGCGACVDICPVDAVTSDS
jgi:MinD superfamily P-loop ATPase